MSAATPQHEVAPDPLNDRVLLARARAGEESAFAELVERHRPRLLRLCTAMLRGDRHLAEDVVQECLLKAVRHLRSDDRPLRLKPWLDTIARNACIDEYRRRRAHPVAEVPDTPVAPFELPDPFLSKAWNRLGRRQRLALRLRDLEGRPYAEIALLLGVTPGAAQALLLRSRGALRREYERVGGSSLAVPQLGVVLEASGVAGRVGQRTGAAGALADGMAATMSPSSPSALLAFVRGVCHGWSPAAAALQDAAGVGIAVLLAGVLALVGAVDRPAVPEASSRPVAVEAPGPAPQPPVVDPGALAEEPELPPPAPPGVEDPPEDAGGLRGLATSALDAVTVRVQRTLKPPPVVADALRDVKLTAPVPALR